MPYKTGLWLLALVLSAGMANARDEALRPLSAVLDELRQGGFVIYFRHAATVGARAGAEADDLAHCGTQRVLSGAGQADAVQIGKAIKLLGVPVGKVSASPYCRTRETAQLIFGRFEQEPDLGFVIGTDAAETGRLAASLRRMLATPPDAGTNSALVSHSANLLEAAGIFAKPEGAAYVFRPLPDGRFEAVARALPVDWQAAARLAAGK